MRDRTPVLGEMVIYHDPVAFPHPALVTAVFTPTCINVVFLSKDEAKHDPYGRQIERETSVTHKDTNTYGRYWRFADEEPNPIVAPQQV